MTWVAVDDQWNEGILEGLYFIVYLRNNCISKSLTLQSTISLEVIVLTLAIVAGRNFCADIMGLALQSIDVIDSG